MAAELTTTTGAYFKRGKQVRSSAPSYDVDLAAPTVGSDGIAAGGLLA